MSECRHCGKRIDKRNEDYGNSAIKIPYLNLVIWRYDFSHNSCESKEDKE